MKVLVGWHLFPADLQEREPKSPLHIALVTLASQCSQQSSPYHINVWQDATAKKTSWKYAVSVLSAWTSEWLAMNPVERYDYKDIRGVRRVPHGVMRPKAHSSGKLKQKNAMYYESMAAFMSPMNTITEFDCADLGIS